MDPAGAIPPARLQFVLPDIFSFILGLGAIGPQLAF